MARPRKPQTLEDALKQVDLRLRQNETERIALLDEKKKIQAQIEVQDFNILRELLTAQGMTVRDLVEKLSIDTPQVSELPAIPQIPEIAEGMMTQ